MIGGKLPGRPAQQRTTPRAWPRWARLEIPSATLFLLAGFACTQPDPPTTPATPEADWPATARGEMVAALQADMQAPRDPADGGGKAWLVSPATPVQAGAYGRWEVMYEVGPAGIAEGGVIFLQVSPFWDWSTPQTTSPDGPGYTEVSLLGRDPRSAAVELEPATLDRQLLAILVNGAPLPPGEQVRIVYGAGSMGARADRYAEHGSRFWFAVDGDGDGVRAVLPDSPALDVQAGPPAQMLLHIQSTARVGDTVRLTLALLDYQGNAGFPATGSITLQVPEGLNLPATVQLSPADGGHLSLSGTASRAGVFRVQAAGPDGLLAESNPLMVADQGYPVYWGDIHGHSNLSDGTGTPDDYYRNARDVAGLDVAALTDHDHWGMLFLDQTPALWQEVKDAARDFHAPGRFISLLGYEWTSWVWGHRHVLYFGDEGSVFSTLDPATDEPAELWQALQGQNALTIAHHSAGGPIAIDWRQAPPPALEPVTEVASVHGSSEAEDSPGPIYSLVPGNTVRDALVRGYDLGFVGGGDSHDGHPGLAHLSGASGGLTAFLTRDLSRQGLRECLLARRTYTTNGPRILLRATLNGHPMGAQISPGPAHLVAAVFGTAPIQRLEVIRGRSGEQDVFIDVLQGDGQRDLLLDHDLDPLSADAFVYLRVTQQDGGAAWSSPFFVSLPDAR